MSEKAVGKSEASQMLPPISHGGRRRPIIITVLFKAWLIINLNLPQPIIRWSVSLSLRLLPYPALRRITIPKDIRLFPVMLLLMFDLLERRGYLVVVLDLAGSCL